MFLPLRCRVIILAHCAGASLGSFHFDVIVHYIAGMLYLLLVISAGRFICQAKCQVLKWSYVQFFKEFPSFSP